MYIYYVVIVVRKQTHAVPNYDQCRITSMADFFTTGGCFGTGGFGNILGLITSGECFTTGVFFETCGLSKKMFSVPQRGGFPEVEHGYDQFQ